MYRRLVRMLESLCKSNKQDKRPRSARLAFEVLEDRSVPTAGSVNGLVFLNSQSNPLPGVTIVLDGDPAVAAPPVHLTAVTDGSGAFEFNGIPAGDYQITTGPFTGIMGTATIGGVTSSAGVNIVAPAIVGAQTNVVVTGGLAPGSVWLGLFFNSGSSSDFPFAAAAGSGDPNGNPFVSLAIANQSLSTATPNKVIDLAGHFSDPTIADSSVTMNITANGVAKQMNLTLFDTTAPQTVANFYNYINSGAYNNSFFHRNSSQSGPTGVGVLQGGGAKITDGVGPSVLTSLGTIPDEIGAPNLKGTLAMANTGTANTASNQFYFNTVNNTSLNTKFTVFGEVSDTASQAVLDSLAATGVQDLGANNIATGTAGATEAGNTVTITTTSAHGLVVGQSILISGVGVAGYNGTFTIDSVPTPTTFTYTNPTAGLANSGGGRAGPAFAVNNPSLLLDDMPLTGGAVTDFPTAASKYLVLNSIVVNRRDDFLTYTVISNTNPTLVTAVLTNEQLTIAKGTGTGTTTITVQATDRFGNIAQDSFIVTVT